MAADQTSRLLSTWRGTFSEAARRGPGVGSLGLLLELTRAAWKTSEYRSPAGVLWSLLGPAVMLLVQYVVFKDRFGGAIPAYPAYLLVGILLVSFFVATVGFLVTVFVGSADLVLNTTVPRMGLVLARLAVHGYKLALYLLLCVGIAAAMGVAVGGGLLLLPLLAAAFLVLVFSVGLVLALLRCFVMDVQHLWAALSPLWFFATPVFYAADILDPAIQLMIVWANPLTPFVRAFRGSIMGGEPALVTALLQCLFVAAGSLALAFVVFRRLEGPAVERA